MDAGIAAEARLYAEQIGAALRAVAGLGVSIEDPALRSTALDRA